MNRPLHATLLFPIIERLTDSNDDDDDMGLCASSVSVSPARRTNTLTLARARTRAHRLTATTQPATPPSEAKPSPPSAHASASSSSSAARPATATEAASPSHSGPASGATKIVSKDLTRATPKQTPIDRVVKMGKQLGSGTFAVVRQAQMLSTGREIAVKCVEKKKLTQEDLDGLFVEVSVMQVLKHPNVLQLIDFYEDSRHYYLLMELVTGGELFERIVQKSVYSERDAREVIRTMTEAIGYCHERNIAHRDLKPENILLLSDADDAALKIADFGFAKPVDDGGLKTACGTPGYVAPEILAGTSYGVAVDMWSIGVIAYILLCGYPPFYNDNQAELFRTIRSGKFDFPPEDWDSISEDAKDLVRKLLVVDPRKRFTYRQVLQHKWICGDDVRTVALGGALDKLKAFNARRKWKGAANAVRHVVRLQMLTSAASAAKSPSPVPSQQSTA